MAETAFAFEALVHPHQLEVQDFASYGLVIDARSAAEFEADHIPGAVNLPASLAATKSESSRAQGLPNELSALLAGLARADALLVYCDRGGLDSQVWAECLRGDGWAVDLLPGGWPSYRRWVDAGLELLPRSLRWRLLLVPAEDRHRILAELVANELQVLDPAALVRTRNLPDTSASAALSGVEMTQARFESELLEALRRLDPEREVFAAEGPLPSNLTLPAALREALTEFSRVQ
jgi:tRNA 2-selenouridine synthase